MLRPLAKLNGLDLLWSGIFLAVLNTFSLEIAVLGLIAGGCFLAGSARILGPRLLPEQTLSQQKIIGVLGVIAILAILGSALYYFAPVTKIGLVLILTVFAIGLSFLAKQQPRQKEKRLKLSHRSSAVFIIIILVLMAWFQTVLPIEILTATRTPWDYLAPTTILALGLSLTCLTILLTRPDGRNLTLILFATTLFAAVSVAALIYPAGFGFDPFIHRATVSHIAEFGTITPKPFYYIGQYALELIAVLVFSLPLKLVDIFLVPVLAATMLTGAAVVGLNLTLKQRHLLGLSILFLLPLSAFTVTTPQSLAYIFTAVLLFLSLPRLIGKKQAPPIFTLTIFALAALVTHPLAGIPAAIYLVLVVIATAETGYPTLQKIGLGLSALAGAVALPIVFVYQAASSGLSITFSPENLFNFSKLNLPGYFNNQYSTWLDGLYLVIDNLLWILLVLAVVGLIFSLKYKARWTLILPLVAVMMWLVNYWILTTTLEFEFLIEYERSNYADRLLVMSMLFALPHAAFALTGIHQTLKEKPRVLELGFLVLLAAAMTANIYGAYPRHDNYARSAGFNVSQTDFNAVHEINRLGSDDDYIVLANQAVSAAALESFGFKKYYQDDIFYYPIPTGGELYHQYLEMTNKAPTRERAEAAMDIAGVNQAFFVVNDYWWQAEQIVEYAKNEANDWFALDDGAITVFYFER